MQHIDIAAWEDKLRDTTGCREELEKLLASPKWAENVRHWAEEREDIKATLFGGDEKQFSAACVAISDGEIAKALGTLQAGLQSAYGTDVMLAVLRDVADSIDRHVEPARTALARVALGETLN